MNSIKYCLNPQCRKLVSAMRGDSNYCSDECEKAHSKMLRSSRFSTISINVATRGELIGVQTMGLRKYGKRYSYSNIIKALMKIAEKKVGLDKLLEIVKKIDEEK